MIWYIVLEKSGVTIQQEYAFTADDVKKRRLNRNKFIAEGDFAWICSRNCEGNEQLQSENNQGGSF